MATIKGDISEAFAEAMKKWNKAVEETDSAIKAGLKEPPKPDNMPMACVELGDDDHVWFQWDGTEYMPLTEVEAGKALSTTPMDQKVQATGLLKKKLLKKLEIAAGMGAFDKLKKGGAVKGPTISKVVSFDASGNPHDKWIVTAPNGAKTAFYSEKMAKEAYSKEKALNFGLMYGGVSSDLDIVDIYDKHILGKPPNWLAQSMASDMSFMSKNYPPADKELHSPHTNPPKGGPPMPLVTKTQGQAALEKIGIHHSVFAWLNQYHIKAKVTPDGIHLLHGDKEVPYKGGVIPMSVDQLSALSKGTMAADAKADLMMSAQVVIGAVLTQELDQGVVVTPDGVVTEHDVTSEDHPTIADEAAAVLKALGGSVATKVIKVGPKKGALDMLPDAEPLQSVAPAATKWPPFDLKNLKTAPLTKLRDAQCMYQPVSGTSAGSRYYMIAANNDIKVAVRWQAQTLSIRVEGDGLNKVIDQLAEAGFDKKGTKTEYTSIHVQVQNAVICRKALGAVLMGIGLPWETPLPDLNLIKE